MDFTTHLEQLKEHLHDSSTLPTLHASPACAEAFSLASTNLAPSLLNHSIRVFLHAQRRAAPNARLDHLYVAAMLHDLGTSPAACGPQRFEVEGADAASAVLERHGASKEHQSAVWQAIALHTSAGIAERMGPPVDTLRCAIFEDFAEREALEPAARAYADSTETVFPRGDVETCLADKVVAQAWGLQGDARGKKAPPASWPGMLLQAKVLYPGFKGTNPAFTA